MFWEKTLCVFIILFFNLWIFWLAGLGCLGSKIQNLMGSSSTRFVKRRVSLRSRLWNDRYLCEPRYEAMGIFLSPIKNELVSVWARFWSERVSVWARFLSERVYVWTRLKKEREMGIFLSPIKKMSGYLFEPNYKVSGYLCEPDYKVSGYLCDPDYEFK